MLRDAADSLPKLVRPADLARCLRVSRSTVYRWLRQGVLTRIKVGGVTFVSVAEVKDLVAVRSRATRTSGDLERRAAWLLEEMRARESRSSRGGSA